MTYLIFILFPLYPGPRMPSKASARNMAALLCIKALHKEGELNDWFMSGKLDERTVHTLCIEETYWCT